VIDFLKVSPKNTEKFISYLAIDVNVICIDFLIVFIYFDEFCK
jgi:hypothetical protein